MKFNFFKVFLILMSMLLVGIYDIMNLEPIQSQRIFNVVAEFYMAFLAAFLFLTVDRLRIKHSYVFLNWGFFLAFLSMFIDGMDEFHIHGELYTAIFEKLTMIVSCTLILTGMYNSIVYFERKNSTLGQQVITDELTGLFNRRGLMARVDEMMQEADENKQSVAFIIADLDDFKKYNDTLGHLEGDELLKKLGIFLRSLVNKEQVIGRWGGEEFAFCVLAHDQRLLLEFAEMIRKQVMLFPFPNKEELGPMTMSLGVAELIPGETAIQAIKRADQSLYEAKSNGKNQVVFHQKSLK